ncbi:DUF4142 domain-containing protein [Bradyrhizobium japonicum]|uniref:DUF4142 domain-containing protein n=1 Tax=Bradyrhizobium TaxID=374 RepID=UPI0021670C29|nr:DUF4142 domain-containing protein [Bradyrhizobium japonicum]MCS3502860.1 putative outer membrane protein [Bradyrhizobium japonicum]MCS3964424.1 putative outer membrane protein [Bradyrhizobium japonicum]MCS3996734.1 putative outer membrane protein [Bradyrhizobium japonicum]
MQAAGDSIEHRIVCQPSFRMNSPSGPNAKQKAEHDKMSKMSGAGFDKMFATHMVADHQKDIAEYKRHQKVRMLLENMLPTR